MNSTGAQPETAALSGTHAHGYNLIPALSKEASQLTELLLAVTTEGIFGINAEGECLFINDSAAAMLGYPAGALHGKRILDLIQVAGDDSQFKRRDGSLLSVRILSYPWNRALYGRGSICVFQDLSEQSRLERLLRDAVRRRRELVKYCSNGIYETSREGELLSVNAGLVRLLGFASEHELRAVDVKDLYVNAQDRSDKIAQLERDGFLRNVVLTLRRKDGAIMRVLENAHAVSGDDGRIVYYEGILTPIADE